MTASRALIGPRQGPGRLPSESQCEVLAVFLSPVILWTTPLWKKRGRDLWFLDEVIFSLFPLSSILLLNNLRQVRISEKKQNKTILPCTFQVTRGIHGTSVFPPLSSFHWTGCLEGRIHLGHLPRASLSIILLQVMWGWDLAWSQHIRHEFDCKCEDALFLFLLWSGTFQTLMMYPCASPGDILQGRCDSADLWSGLGLCISSTFLDDSSATVPWITLRAARVRGPD